MIEQQEDAVLMAAAEHIRHNRLDAAEELIRGRAKERPDDPLARKQLATIAFKRGDMTRAATLLGDVLAANERDADALTLLSAVHLAQRRADEALTCAERAYALEPEGPLRKMNLAIAEQAAGHVGRAVERLEALVKEDPSSPELAYNLGTMYLDMGRNRLARREFLRVTELGPNRVEGWANLGAAEKALGNLPAALQAIDRALFLDPLAPNLLTSKASMLSDAGEQDQAIELSERAATLQPRAGMPLITKSLAQMRAGAWAQALATLAQTLRLEADSSLATFALAVVLRRQGKLHESLLALERAEQIGGNDLGGARALFLLQLGRFEQGFELWNRRPTGKGTAQASSLSGLDRLLVLPDPDPTVTLALLRYVSLLQARGLQVLLAAPRGYAGLVERLTGPIQALQPSDPVPEGVAIASLRRLPFLLGAPRDIPWSGPYVHASTQAPAGLRPRIGVCPEAAAEDWCGRSWCPRGWAEPAWSEVVGSLGGMGEVILLRPDAPFDVLIEQVAGVDLVVALDGRIAHLAGAMGRPLIVVLDVSGGWAWPVAVEETPPEDRERSPWYPDAHVVRERARADFTLPFDRVAELVAQVLGARAGREPPSPG